MLVPSETRKDAPVRKPRATNSERSSTRRERPQRDQNRERDERQGRQHQDRPASGNANSFHEGNLPAFLQRPVRAEKPTKKAPREASEEPTADVDG